MTRWHVCVTDSRAERETVEDIHALNAGFQAYCPTQRHKRFIRGHKVICESALFPRYIFVEFDASDNWPALLEVDGICDVLRNNGTPSPVPDGVTEKLMRLERHGLFDFTQAPNPFPPGTKVRVVDEPFADLLAVVRRVRSNDRCDVLLRWLGREMLVNVPMARLSHI